MGDLEKAEQQRVLARLEMLGLAKVQELAAVDGFPAPWRLLVTDWIAQRLEKS
jgi:hypothetical protein